MWEAYRPQILIGVSVMMLQAALIAALLFERRRRQRTADALARQDEHLRLATEAAGLSPWIFDPIERSSGVDDRKAGRDAPERMSVADFHDTLAQMPPQHRAAATAALGRARETRGSFEIEYPLEEADGTLRWQAARGRADGTRPERLIGVAVDVTSRKRAELQAEQDRAALQHMTRVSLLGQLSASIAHQLNQPLASIRSNAEAAKTMLDRMPVDIVELREICADIVAEDDRAAQVIRRLGVLFKRGTPLLEPIDLNELVLDTVELTRGLLATRHVSVETRLATALPRVPGDRVNLQQVLLNLIVNAADAIADLPNERRRVTIATEARDGEVRLCVTDHGAGVPPDAIDAVFEPFWSTRPGGMGMGLAVCRAIVEAHRGTIAVANAADGGAQFSVALPLADS
jgi:C4-dicarboxylate-specific signal transduction histidine kinase